MAKHTAQKAFRGTTMTATQVTFLIFGLAALTACGDYLLKIASFQPQPFHARAFILGAFIYAMSAFGWVVMFKHIKMSTIAALYSLSNVLVLATLGVLFFNEQLNHYEVAGIICAVASILLLSRFS